MNMQRQSPRLRLAYFDDCHEVKPKRWLIKGLFARGEISNWNAPPGAGKSALFADVSIYLAAGRDWRGFRCKERCGVLYLAFERAELTKRRFMAYAKQGFKNLPIAISNQIIDLLASNAPEIILTAIREAGERLGVPIGLVIIDTRAKGIAIGGGDEDKAKDQDRCHANLRRVQEADDVHIAIIGHTGKDESRGGRGSNAPRADADLEVQLSSNGSVKTAKVVKANDLQEGDLLHFTMRSAVLGIDEDGDEIAVGILCDGEITAPARSAPKSDRLPKAAQIALRALSEALDEQGEPAPPSNHVPPGVRVVTISAWRQQAYRRGISTSEEDRAKQQAFKRASEYLIGAGRVAAWDGHVWLPS
jgi:hypothetical protein